MPAERRGTLRRVVSSVRFRVTALAAVAVAVVLIAAGIGLLIAHRQLLVGNLDDSLEERADDLAAISADGGVPATLSGSDDDTAVQIVGDDGVVIAATGNLRTDEPIGSAPDSRQVELVRTVDDLPVDDGRFRLLSQWTDGPGGPAVIHVAGSLEDVEESTAVLVTSLAVGVPAVVILLAAIIWWLVGRTLRPVDAMRAEVAAITGSDLHRRVPEPATADEIARLAQTMNAMLDRVEEASERQRRFVADASHELRSPLTRIRAEIEVDLAHPDTADLTATHHSVLDETAALQRLVDDLLVLARHDAVPLLARVADVDVDDIVLRHARRLRERDGLVVDSHHVTAVRVVGDADQLDRAVGNLVDNAARYAAGTVAIELTEHDGRAVIAISDDGPGIPASDRERVFERFARLDQARSRGEGGAGLGLAIAREIVRRHGGDVVIDPDHTAGARFVVTLPLADPRDEFPASTESHDRRLR